MKRKSTAVASLVVNCLLFAVTTGVVISYFIAPGKLIRSGLESFRFFTTDSNVLAAVAAALTAVCQVQLLRGKRQRLPRVLTCFKLAGTVSLLLTFFTVLVLLVPAYGAATQLGGTGFHMHVAAPLLSLLSFVWLDGHDPVPASMAWTGTVPVIVYGAVYFTQVIVLQSWTDFYLFNRGGLWYVTALVLFGVSFGLSVSVCLLQRKIVRKLP